MAEPTVLLEVSAKVTDAVGRVRLRGHLGRHGAPLVTAAVRAVLEEGAGVVEVNLADVSGVDGDGVEGIARAQAVAAENGVDFVVSSCDVPEGSD